MTDVEAERAARRLIRNRLVTAIHALNEVSREYLANPTVVSAEFKRAIHTAGHLLNNAADDAEGRLVNWPLDSPTRRV